MPCPFCRGDLGLHDLVGGIATCSAGHTFHWFCRRCGPVCDPWPRRVQAVRQSLEEVVRITM